MATAEKAALYLGFSCCFRVAMMDSDLYWDGQQGTCVEAAVKGAVNTVWSPQSVESTVSSVNLQPQ